jgi:hypothetical protein
MKIPQNISRRNWMISALSFLGTWMASPVLAQIKYRPVRSQYIAALAPADATSGTGAETWGFWRVDPGPIGVWLHLYKVLRKAGNIAPAGWRFDIDDWWLDENGLIMKAPEFPIPPGKYLVTNGEDQAAMLTIEEPDQDGKQNWSLNDGKTIGNVTHGPCRSARYTPIGASGTCTPENADQSIFPLKLGETLPPVTDCNRKIYAVLIVFGYPVEG